MKRLVLTLAMAVHELTTNAAKYGALSVSGGRIEVSWRPVPNDNAEPMLELQWIEQGGPKVAQPESRGFGSKLIEGSIAAELGGKTSLVFDPAGLRCEMLIPLAAAAANTRKP